MRIIIIAFLTVQLVLGVPAYVGGNGTGHSGGGQTTQTVTYTPAGNGAGRALVVICDGYSDNGTETVAVTDDKSNSYSNVAAIIRSAGASDLTPLAAAATFAYAGTGLFTFTCTWSTGVDHPSAIVIELSGVTNTIDQHSENAPGIGGQSFNPNSGNITTSLSSGILISATNTTSLNAITFTANNSFTKQVEVNNALTTGTDLAASTFVFSSTGTYAGDWTINESVYWSCIVFSIGASGATTPIVHHVIQN